MWLVPFSSLDLSAEGEVWWTSDWLSVWFEGGGVAGGLSKRDTRLAPWSILSLKLLA